MRLGCCPKVRDRCGNGGHSCLKFCDLVVHARRGCTGATSSSLSGSNPGGLAGVHQLPMLGLLGRGKTIVDVSGVTLGLNIGHLVDFLLGNEPASTRVTTMSTAMARPAAALATTSTFLIKGQNDAALGNNVIGLEGLTTFSMSSLLSYNNGKFRHLGTTFEMMSLSDDFYKFIIK
jgi:hypothetical protein